MDINFLRYFQTVATLEHMTRAAEVLHVSQPALSMAISKLEQELGVPLFDRQGRGVKLNNFGEVLLSHIDVILTEIDEAKEEIQVLKDQQESNLGLVSNFKTMLQEMMNCFSRDYPNTSVRQVTLPWDQLEDALRTGDTNFCISSPPITGPGLTCLVLNRVPFYLLTAKRHRFSGSTGVHLAELADEAFISYPEGFGNNTQARLACQKAGFTPNVIFTVNSTQNLLKYVSRGLGITLIPVPSWVLPLNSVSTIPLLDPISPNVIGMTYLEGAYFSTAAQNFKATVLEYFSKFPS